MMRLLAGIVQNKIKYIYRKDELMCNLQLGMLTFQKRKKVQMKNINKGKKLCMGNAWTYCNTVAYTKMLLGFNYRN